MKTKARARLHSLEKQIKAIKFVTSPSTVIADAVKDSEKQQPEHPTTSDTMGQSARNLALLSNELVGGHVGSGRGSP